MPKANFEIIKFSEHLGNNAGDIDAPWAAFVGNQTTQKQFQVPGKPIGAAYLVLQVYDVQNLGHRIVVNGKDLPGFDIARTTANRWQIFMDIIPSGFLKQGGNSIQIFRAGGGDNILIGSVVVNWKEAD